MFFLIFFRRHNAASEERRREWQELLLRVARTDDGGHRRKRVPGVWHARGGHVRHEARDDPADPRAGPHGYPGRGTSGEPLSLLLPTPDQPTSHSALPLHCPSHITQRTTPRHITFSAILAKSRIFFVASFYLYHSRYLVHRIKCTHSLFIATTVKNGHPVKCTRGQVSGGSRRTLG